MEGFKVEMKERIRGSLSHLVVEGIATRQLVGEDSLLDAARSTPGVEAASPFIETLAIYRSAVLDYCILRGVDPSSEAEVSDFDLYLLSDEEIEQLLADQSSLLPSRQFVTREMRDQVREAIESLNERQRLAVLLHKFEGMSYADIGVSMDLTPQAVKSLLSRARENLKLHLKKYVSH